MAAKISHVLVRGFCDSPSRESIPIAQALTTPTAKNSKAIIRLSVSQHEQDKGHRTRNHSPSENQMRRYHSASVPHFHTLEPGKQGMLKARHPIPVGTSYLSKCRDESLGAGFASHCNNEISLLWKRGQLRDLKHTSVQSHWRLAELARPKVRFRWKMIHAISFFG